MGEIHSLLKRIDRLIAVIEHKQQQQARLCLVRLCNAAGEPLPTGPESEQQPKRGKVVYIKNIILAHEHEGDIA